MSNLRFNQVFVGLMLLGAVSAFIVPPRFTNAGRAQLQGIFAPVALPVRAIAARIHARFSDQRPLDEGATDGRQRAPSQIILENTQLRMTVASLTKQLNDLQERDADRRQVGPVLELCRPFTVLGADPGARESLTISGANLDGLQRGMAALYPGGIAGRIDRAGVGGATVQLVTDPGFAATVSFARFRKDAKDQVEFVNLRTPPTLLRGAGDGAMRIAGLSRKDAAAAGLDVGDWVVLNDPDWNRLLQGYRIGRIVAKRDRADAPLFVDLLVRPYGDPSTLREVMVMVRQPPRESR